MKNPPPLSPAEQAVLELLAEGYRTSEIAKHLSLEYRAVADIIRTIKSGLNPCSREKIRELAEYYKNMSRPR